jgi:hypothetical protein
MVQFKQYLAGFYRVEQELKQGAVLLFSPDFEVGSTCFIFQKSVPRANPPKVLDPVGVVIIENECDLVEHQVGNSKAERYRKTETVEFLYVYDAGEFLFPILHSLKSHTSNSTTSEKEKRGLLKFIENADIDNMNFYLPPHPLFGVHTRGLIAYCKKSQTIGILQLPKQGPFACIIPPHRDKLRNFHLKYDLRIPTDDVMDFDAIEWIKSAQ